MHSLIAFLVSSARQFVQSTLDGQVHLSQKNTVVLRTAKREKFSPLSASPGWPLKAAKAVTKLPDWNQSTGHSATGVFVQTLELLKFTWLNTLSSNTTNFQIVDLSF